MATSLKQHGGHDKLADAAASGLGRGKDKDYVQKLSTYSSGRLLDMVRVSERHKASASAKAAKAAALAKPRVKVPEKPLSRKAAKKRA